MAVVGKGVHSGCNPIGGPECPRQSKTYAVEVLSHWNGAIKMQNLHCVTASDGYQFGVVCGDWEDRGRESGRE